MGNGVISEILMSLDRSNLTGVGKAANGRQTQGRNLMHAKVKLARGLGNG